MKPKTKKSETLQVRLPHGMKRDFMQRCETEGRSASDLLRDFIDGYLAGPVEILTSQRATMIRRRFVYPTLAAAFAIGLVVTLSPGASQADTLREEFDAMDANGDGYVVASEYRPSADGVGYFQTTSDGPPAARPASAPKAAVKRANDGRDAQRAIDSADVDRDGRMSFEEHRNVRVLLARVVFKMRDVNADQRVSRDEYVEGALLPPQVRDRVWAQMRTRLSDAQIDAYMAQATRKASDYFKARDGDGDGYLSLEELTPS